MKESGIEGNNVKMANSKPDQPKKESMLANLMLNIVIPTLILMKGSKSEWLSAQLVSLDSTLNTSLALSYGEHGTKWALIIALAFPIVYGIKDFFRARKVNLFSALGVFSLFMTGGISLLELDPQYIAIKEAAIPGIIGLVTIFSLRTKYPLVRTFLYNENILNVERIGLALKERNNEADFDKTLVVATWMLAGSFFFSSFLNYVLAKVLLVSPPGTAAFNEELGKMTALSFPMIAIPATLIMMGALGYLFWRIKKLTDLSFDDIMVEH